jgi:16S rRNA (uracil1498-N3)-methyltransferase
MKIHRFFINQIINDDENEIKVSDPELIHQLKNVLRIKIGDRFVFVDNDGSEVKVTSKEIMKKSLSFSKEKMKKFSRKNEVSVTLCPAVLKKDKMEYVLQKCTEIGVLYFCPLVSDRTEKTNLNMKRLNKIIKEAAEQSEKNRLPSLCDVTDLEQFLSENETKQNLYYLDMDAPLINVTQIVERASESAQQSDSPSIFILVGPEGGWSQEDRDKFTAYSVKPISLGDKVLRAETASISVASLLLLGR